MKFTCEKSLLVNALSVASRTVAQKSAISALEGIHLKAGMYLYISGYNLETGITVTVDHVNANLSDKDRHEVLRLW